MERQIRARDHIFAQRKPTERHVVAIPTVARKEHHHADCAHDRHGEQHTLVAHRSTHMLRRRPLAGQRAFRVDVRGESQRGEHVQQRAHHERDEDFLVHRCV